MWTLKTRWKRASDPLTRANTPLGSIWAENPSRRTALRNSERTAGLAP
jgi:hypothetical protein